MYVGLHIINAVKREDNLSTTLGGTKKILFIFMNNYMYMFNNILELSPFLSGGGGGGGGEKPKVALEFSPFWDFGGWVFFFGGGEGKSPVTPICIKPSSVTCNNKLLK